MKRVALFLFFVSFVLSVQAQKSPVKLVGKVKHLSGDKYELIISANIEPEWVVYSQNIPKGGPYPTKISFSKEEGYELIGKPTESSKFKRIVNDEIFHILLTKYYKNVLFKQVVRIKDKKIKIIHANINYMTCNGYRCMPPVKKKVKFVI